MLRWCDLSRKLTQDLVSRCGCTIAVKVRTVAMLRYTIAKKLRRPEAPLAAERDKKRTFRI
jgi:hypothetical protein